MPNKNLIYFQGEIDNKAIQKLSREPYKLQVDDVIAIDVKATKEEYIELFSKKDLLSGYTVDRSGSIRLPLIGKINVLGNTTVEVREKLDKEFLKFFNSKDDFCHLCFFSRC